MVTTVEQKIERNERILRGLTAHPVHMWLDQHDQKIWAGTIKELIDKHNARYCTRYRSAAKMYQDKKDGRTVECGRIIGKMWYVRFAPVEIEA